MSHTRIVAAINGQPCSECYFYGFVNDRPENSHFCDDCLMSSVDEKVPITFAQWQATTSREAFKNVTFEQMIGFINSRKARVAYSAEHRYLEQKVAVDVAQILAVDQQYAGDFSDNLDDNLGDNSNDNLEDDSDDYQNELVDSIDRLLDDQPQERYVWANELLNELHEYELHDIEEESSEDSGDSSSGLSDADLDE